VRHLVVVVPGIGGSVLEPVDRGASPVWDASVPGVARTLVDPARLGVDEHPVLRPTGLAAGVVVLGRVAVIPGYRGLVRSLCDTFGASSAVLSPAGPAGPAGSSPAAAEVLLFPYDFRLGVAAAAERLAEALHPLVGSADARWPGRPVLVVAHSMGGLVARYWAGALGGWRHSAAIITLGTPHRGAPKALGWLVDGVRLGRTWREATAVLRGWPGARDLIPRYAAVWDAAAGRAIRPEELPAGCVNASGSLAATAGGVGDALAAGARTHADIAAGWGDIPAGRAPAVHAVFARGHKTPAEAVLAGGRLRVRKRDAAWLAVGGWDGGDGTVPAYSAVPVELADDVRARVPVWERHGPLGCSPEAVRLVGEHETGSTAAIRGEGDPGLTLDLDEFAAPGAEVAAGLRNAEAGEETRVTLRVRPAGLPPGPARRWADAPMASADGVQWRARLPVSAPGTYEVRVEAAGVPRAAVPPAGDVIEVVGEQAELGSEGCR
jgi:Lecithin:cholesterol acyltransferase